MSIYVCSDIHGKYDLFMKLLKAVNFSDNDLIYILGDIIDKGYKSIKLIDFLTKQKNIHCIMGNHEYHFTQYYKNMKNLLSDSELTNDKILSNLQQYFPSDKTRLTWKHIEYIKTLPFFVETDNFIGVHAGLQIDHKKHIYPLIAQSFNYMLFDNKFKDAKIKNNFGKPILFGHTPCNYDNQSGEFIKDPDIKSKNIFDYSKIRLDTGVQDTNMLGALRIEDMKEFYVK